jgi:hypothetical protein
VVVGETRTGKAEGEANMLGEVEAGSCSDERLGSYDTTQD